MATETIVAHLFHREAPKKAEQKKDKLAETKKQEALVKQAFKAEREEQKKDKEEEIHAAAEAFRMERSWNPISKRAQKDARHQAKHEAKIAEGQMCEHGIWKCRICFPHKSQK